VSPEESTLRSRKYSSTPVPRSPEPSRRPATTLLSQGTVLEDRYEVLRICGRGGMSTVYAARDLRFRHVERLCAVKEMHVDAPDDKTRVLRISNFEREAEMLATLSHPAIPKIFDFFNNGGLIYLVLEFIDGQDLESVIESSTGPIDEQTLIDWSLQILDVLAYIHERPPEPIVFRDLKPSNIMLRSDGSVVLIDFGIARTFQPMQRGTMIGTEGYAPPEQYRGIAEPRGDIYALGATLHHLATGSDPRNETPFTFDQRPPRTLNPDLSQQFEAIIRRALAYSAADRFPSATALAQALRSLKSPETSFPSVPSGSPAESELEYDQHGNRRKFETRMVVDSSEQPLPDGSHQPKERVLWSIQTGDEVRGSASILHSRAYIGSYDNGLYALSAKDGSILWRFRAQRGVITRPTVLGETLIFGSEDQNIYGLRNDNGRLIWSHRAAMPIRSSPVVFGDSVILGSDDTYCYRIDAKHGSLLWRQRTWGPVRSSPIIYKGSVLIGSDDGAVYRLNASDGRTVWRCPLGRAIMSSPAVENEIVVVGGVDGQIYALDFETGERRWSFPTQRPVLASPRVLGSTAFVGSTDGAVYAINIDDGTEIWRSQIGNQVTSTMGIYEGYGYVGTIDGHVHCLNLQGGETVWNYKLGGPVTSSPAIGDGVVVVGSLDGRVYGLRL
jgi:eukaryotic-like serine/threonine-protein kinase